MNIKHVNEIVGAMTIAKQYGRDRAWCLDHVQTLYDMKSITLQEHKRINGIIRILYAK